MGLRSRLRHAALMRNTVWSGAPSRLVPERLNGLRKLSGTRNGLCLARPIAIASIVVPTSASASAATRSGSWRPGHRGGWLTASCERPRSRQDL